MTEVDPSAPTELDDSPRERPEDPALAAPADTVDRLMGELLRELPMGGRESPEPAKAPVADVQLDADGQPADTEERHLAEAFQAAQGFGRTTASSSPVRGQTLGRFIVLGVLGQGGMGTVLRAYDEKLDRKIAIKVLHAGKSEQYTKRLLREAQAMAKLSHPNVVQVYEVGEVEEQVFIAMELVKGEPLDRWQARNPSWRECAEVYLEAGQGLAAAHAAGLVHRDFKPGNCIVDEHGRARVLDFGLAREVKIPTDEAPLALGLRTVDDAVGSFLTKPGTVMGTMAYMPLEQMQGQVADERADQFSFCVSIYEAVYGERPFEGRTMLALMNAAASGDVRPAPKGSKVPAKLRRLLLRGLAAEPGQRWQSMDALLEQLRKLVAPKRRRRIGAGVAAGLITSGAVLLLGSNAEGTDHCPILQTVLDDGWDDECGYGTEMGTLALDAEPKYASNTRTPVKPQGEEHAAPRASERTATGCFDAQACSDGTDSTDSTTNGPFTTSDIGSETAGPPNQDVTSTTDCSMRDTAADRTMAEPLGQPSPPPADLDEGMFGEKDRCAFHTSYIWIANSEQGTVSKINTDTLGEEGRYYTRPDRSGEPKHTSVSLNGDVAVANLHGGIIKIYADLDDCRGPNSSTGATDLLSFADEGCIAWYTPMSYDPQVPVAWTQGKLDRAKCRTFDEKVWTSGLTEDEAVEVVLVDGETGVIDATIVITVAPNGFKGLNGAAVDAQGNFWGSQMGEGGSLVKINADTFEVRRWTMAVDGNGISVDHEGFVWTCSSTVARFDPKTGIWAHRDVGASGGCAIDGGEILWMAGNTLRGVNRETLDVEQSIGLDEYVYGVSMDSDGYIWVVSVENNIYRVDPETKDSVRVGGLGLGEYTHGDMTGLALYNASRGGGP